MRGAPLHSVRNYDNAVVPEFMPAADSEILSLEQEITEMHDECEPDYRELVVRARSGDEMAARTIIERFQPELLTIIRARLPRRLRKVFDSGDAMQEVWRSFLRPKRRVDAASTPESENVRAYLKRMVMNRVGEEDRKFTQTDKYDLEKERPMVLVEGNETFNNEPSSKDPTPSAQVQAKELLASLSAGRTPLQLQMLQYRVEGSTYVEIAKKVGQCERTVRRFFEELQPRGHGVK